MGDVDTEKVLVSEKISFDKKKYKYFLGYLYDNHKVKPLNIMLPKTSAYVKSYKEKHNTIRDKISADIKKEFDSEPVCNKEFLKTKIKSHGNKVTDIYDKNIPKVDSNHTCLAVFTLDSALKKGDSYYPQMFLKRV